MEVKDCIRQRRSIRRYKQTKIGDEDLKEILEAAIWAPSGKNYQPWKFYVLKDTAFIQNVSKLSKYNFFMKHSAAMILVFLDHVISYDDTKDKQAVGAAIQNMLLTCADKGIGACWIGEILNNKERLNALLGLEQSSLELMAVITLGYSEEKAVSHRNGFEDFVIGWK